ncbi:MAG: SemiSWEET family transporter [Patescibacteria group bacterium]|nr:SemiSWEET family transporter [Patescibacteria group bacterium]
MLHQHPVHKSHDSLFHKALNAVIIVVATASPLITLPQLFDIYTKKNVAGVSPITWIAYIFTATIWFAYGIIHRERVIVINGALGIILASLISFGILIYSR